MTAGEVLNTLGARGIRLEPDGDKIRMSAPSGVLTSEDQTLVKTLKPQIYALLTRPALGSIRRPLTVRGRRLDRCPFHGCDGAVNQHSSLKLCGKCGWYFQLLPMEEHA